MIKRSLIFLPTVCLIAIMAWAKFHYDNFSYFSTFLNTLPLLIFMGLDLTLRKKPFATNRFIQASFYVYLFGVISLTVFYIHFLTIYEAIQTGNFSFNLEAVDYNLVLFTKFKDYSLTHRQVVGNLIMLLPLGIYLPVLYRRITTFSQVLITGFLFTVAIETVQYLGSLFTASVSTRVWGLFYSRSFDVDDIFLNTLGVVIGFLLYLIARKLGERFGKHGINFSI
jgi:glycopeptide antibiotics resistance protein